MSLSEPIMSVLSEFESVFSQPTWRKMQVLIVGTLLARGRRTVTAALRQMGLHAASNVRLSHHGRNHARWDNGRRRELAVTSGTAVWYRIGQPVLPIRWVLVRDPKGLLEPRAYCSTCPDDRPRAVVQQFIKRWTIETTFEESRSHLGLETQRQWSDRAIERTTPCLFGLYSVVALLAHALHPDGKIPLQRTAWYDKPQATFADVLAAVRRHLWGELSYSTSAHAPDFIGIPRSELWRLVQALCYTH